MAETCRNVNVYAGLTQNPRKGRHRVPSVTWIAVAALAPTYITSNVVEGEMV